MGTTANWAYPYPELTDQANVPTDMKELADQLALVAPGPPLPAIAEQYVSASIVITSTVRSAETPTQVRASITNPHATRRMLVYVKHDTWADISIASGQSTGNYFESLIISGGVAAAQPTSPRQTLYAPVVKFYGLLLAERYAWVPAAGSAVFGIAANRDAAATTMSLNFTRTSVVPIRYE